MKDKLIIYWENYSFYLWAVLGVIVVITLLIKIDLPKIEEINSKRQELAGIQERLDRLTTKSRVLSSLDNNKLKADTEKVNQVLPDGKDAPSILRNLEVSASISGVIIDDFGLVPGKLAIATTSGDKTNEIPIEIKVSGSVEQITVFLEKITTIGRAMGLKNLEIEFKEASASGKIKLGLAAYFLLPVDAIAKTDDINEPLAAWGSQENETINKIYQREIPPVSQESSSGKEDLFK